MKLFYDVIYRYFRAPWDIGAREELVSLVESGRIKPGRAVDLGCAAGANAIYLAENGFEVTGLDYAQAAIEKARVKAEEAGTDDKKGKNHRMKNWNIEETEDGIQ